MKNANHPAMPANVELSSHDPESSNYPNRVKPFSGLTKLEMIAMHCSASMVSSKLWSESDKPLIAVHAVDMAMALLVEFEKVSCQKL